MNIKKKELDILSMVLPGVAVGIIMLVVTDFVNSRKAKQQQQQQQQPPISINIYI